MNGNFKDRLNNLKLIIAQRAEASEAILNEKLEILIENPGEKEWDIKLTQENIKGIKQATNYSISFEAQSDCNREITTLIKNSNDQTIFGWKKTAITTSMKKYSYNFNSGIDTGEHKLEFLLGSNTSCNVRIGNISLNLATDEENPEEPKPDTPPDWKKKMSF